MSIYERGKTFVYELYKNDSNTWDGIRESSDHIGRNHIFILEDYKSSLKRKKEAYKQAIDELKDDFKSIIYWISQQ